MHCNEGLTIHLSIHRLSNEIPIQQQKSTRISVQEVVLGDVEGFFGFN